MNIQLHVDEIVLDGIELQESQLFDLKLALERQLASRFESSTSQSFTSIEQESLILEAGLSSKPTYLAAQLAGTIHHATLPLRPASQVESSALPPRPVSQAESSAFPPRPAPGRGGQGVRGQSLNAASSIHSPQQSGGRP